MKMQSEANSKLFGFEFLLPDFLAANQGFRLCPKDTGIWIVIASGLLRQRCLKLKTGEVQFRSIPRSSLSCGTTPCVICFGENSWGDRGGGKFIEPVLLSLTC